MAKKQQHRSRKQQRRSRKHRRSQKKHQRGGAATSPAQRGGGSCAAMPLNRSNFQQMGGFADINSPTMLLDQPTQVQAESYNQVQAIDQAVAMAKAQAGGYRRRRSAHRKGSRKHRKGSRSSHRKGSHKHRKGSRKQRGGMAPFPFTNDTQLSPSANPQFETEGSVNPLYHENAGAQPWLMKA